MDNENDEVLLGLGLGVGLGAKRDDPMKRKHVVFVDLSIPPQTSDCDGTEIESSSMGDDAKNHRFCNEDTNGFGRKKLRLTRDQTVLLEDSFRRHTTLNTVQKLGLAEKLNLKPRQVEVWFQNRRARTKLKQTEVDCEFWKKNCERLSEENRRLKKDLSEMLKTTEYQIPKAERHIDRGGAAKKEVAAAAVTVARP